MDKKIVNVTEYAPPKLTWWQEIKAFFTGRDQAWRPTGSGRVEVHIVDKDGNQAAFYFDMAHVEVIDRMYA